MAKLKIDFVLIDESVVMHGFRVLINGAKLAQFSANPVMLFMHNRPLAGMMDEPVDDDVILTIGKWYDIRVVGSQLLAKPDFDDSDEFAQKIQAKVEKGYYNGASIWIDPIATSDDTSLALPGQSGPTVTEWGLFEASIVDIPNCRNSLAIRNEEGETITLAHGNEKDEAIISYLKKFLINKKNTDMDKLKLTSLLGLTEDTQDAVIEDKLNAMSKAIRNLPALQSENDSLKTENAQLKADAHKAKIDALVDGAISEKKLPAGDRDKYAKLAAADFDTVKSLIDVMKAYEPVKDKLKAQTEKDSEFLKMSWDEIDRSNKLGYLKENYPAVYEQKHAEKFPEKK